MTGTCGMKKILAINGSYREGGVTDQILDHFEYAANTFDMQIETAVLRNLHIEFCTNCRRCTQEAGRKPGTCIHEDEMNTLIQKIENADFYVFASPTNMYSSTALFRRFLERLVVYGYWPWSKNAPEFRKEGDVRKKAILVSSCAAPGFMGRYFSDTLKSLKSAAKLVGADSVGSLFVGLVGKERSPRLSDKNIREIKSLAMKLI